MAWSIFTDGGGDGAALTWAQEFLTQLGAPVTPGNEQFVYDWEKSEGGGGKYNPLNQGPVPGQPQLTTTGSQYGGGAADFASYAAGLTGAVDYVNMPNYTAVKAALMANNPVGARNALIQSPWAASHYGYGSAFSNAPLPGQASSLIGDAGTTQATTASNATSTGLSVGSLWNDFLGGLLGPGAELGLSGTESAIGSSLFSGIKTDLVRLGLIIFGGIIVIIGLITLTHTGTVVKTGAEAAVAPEAVAAQGAVKVAKPQKAQPQKTESG